MNPKKEENIWEIEPLVVKSIDVPNYNDPCAGCSNNPKNNPYASGVCGCTLPYINMTY